MVACTPYPLPPTLEILHTGLHTLHATPTGKLRTKMRTKAGLCGTTPDPSRSNRKSQFPKFAGESMQKVAGESLIGTTCREIDFCDCSSKDRGWLTWLALSVHLRIDHERLCGRDIVRESVCVRERESTRKRERERECVCVRQTERAKAGERKREREGGRERET